MPHTYIKYSLSRTAHDGVIVVTGRVIGLVVNMVTQILIGRVLGVNIYGLYTLGRTISEVPQVLGKFGLENTVIRFITLASTRGSSADILTIIKKAFTWMVLISIVVYGLLYLTSDDLANRVFSKPDLSPVILDFIPWMMAFSALGLSVACIRALNRLRLHTVLFDLAYPVTLLILVGISIRSSAGLAGIIHSMSAAAIGVLIIALILLYRMTPRVHHPADAQPDNASGMMSFSLIMTMTNLSQILSSHMDRILLGVLSDNTQLGLFGAAQLFALQTSFFLAVSNTVFSPIYAATHHAGDNEELARVFKFATRWTITLTLPLAFVLLLFNKPILTLFGAHFYKAGNILIILVIAQLINVSVGGVGVLLNMGGKQVVAMINNWLFVILNLVLGLSLIPAYGAFGAAIATAICIAALNLIRLFQVYRYFSMHPFSKWLWRPIGIMILIYAIYLLADHYGLVSLVPSPVSAALFILIYLGLIWTVAAEQEDKDILTGMVSDRSKRVHV